MRTYILRRLLSMIPTLFVISVVSFIIIQLPPGDFLTSYMAQIAMTGETVQEAEFAALEKEYGLDRPVYLQYLIWIRKIITAGDFGRSFEWRRPVSELIWDRIGLTLAVSLGSLAFTYVLAIPIGIYAATHQYSAGDYLATFLGYIGLATPNFLLALVLMFLFYKYFGISVGGLFSPRFVEAPWSIARLVDLFNHLWIPVIVVGTANTCSLIRVMRSSLLDELRKQYVVTAKAKGIPPSRVLFKYPVRISINPLVSTVGYILPNIISGAAITAVVLSLPTTGPLLLRALQSQDMYLAGSFILIIATLTVIGTLISDILLAVVDPRIRFEKAS